MTGNTTLVHATDARTLLGEGAGTTQATPPPKRLECTDWDEYAASFLQAHPEISAAVPSWTEEIDFSEIDDEVEGTIFSFSADVGAVELYGGGKLLTTGEVDLYNGGAPNVYLPGENEFKDCAAAAQWMLDVAQNLIAAAGLLRAEPRLLRRPVGVDAELQRLDI